MLFWGRIGRGVWGWGATAAPMGGRKGSGLGRRHGREGLLRYTEPQTVAVQRLVGNAARLCSLFGADDMDEIAGIAGGGAFPTVYVCPTGLGRLPSGRGRGTAN